MDVGFGVIAGRRIVSVGSQFCNSSEQRTASCRRGAETQRTAYYRRKRRERRELRLPGERLGCATLRSPSPF